MFQELSQFVGKNYTDAEIGINDIAEKYGLNVNVIPDDIDNSNSDDYRLNVWVDLITDKIYKFTKG